MALLHLSRENLTFYLSERTDLINNVTMALPGITFPYLIVYLFVCVFFSYLGEQGQQILLFGVFVIHATLFLQIYKI